MAGSGRRRAPPGRDFRTLSQASAILVLTTALAFAGTPAPTARDRAFADFIASLRPMAETLGVSRKTFDHAFDGVAFDPSVVAETRRQTEFTVPMRDYIAAAVSPDRIARGRDRARAVAPWLDLAAKIYGVDPAALMGIWGLESDYGTAQGTLGTIRSLASLAFVRFRDALFRDELLAALEILQEGDVAPRAMVGSWAGAMGQTQFMPSSFLEFAVDFTGDGRRDIWTSAPDAIGSTANFLAANGWKRGLPWGFEVKLPAGYSGPSGRKNKQPMSAWAARGIVRVDGRGLGEGSAGLMLPAGANGPAFLVTRNFEAIFSYNAAESYSLAIAILAQRLAGGPGIITPWPTDDPGLSRAQRRQLQGLLAKHGYDVGEPDGAIGTKTKQAIADFEQKNGMPVNGRASQKVLEALRR